MTVRHVAVWLDHKEAKVFHIEPDGFEVNKEKAPHHHLTRKAEEQGRHAGSDRFFHEVSLALKDAEEILVVGPSSGKLDFIRYLPQARPRDRAEGPRRRDARPPDRRAARRVRPTLLSRQGPNARARPLTHRISALFAASVFASMVPSTSNAESIAVAITVHADRPGARIDPDIYGQFAEHLGRGIYEGLWVGEGSPIPNTRGYRNDVLDALRALHVPVVRWPGGCFADGYHWRDGIGPRDRRPVTLNSTWGGVEE